jgi:hypothetical protein
MIGLIKSQLVPVGSVGGQLPVTSYQLPVTSELIPNHQSPSHQSPITDY